ncbi:hypothetical protein L21SP5_00217 [Salinivirga cyanobacteriivorans]|uniref:Uncharacterized protein n=1 Tax=Salinivirga cyanobacteriivorans TaxID=1307839 RepID=A0A0S2HV20_9BACT|nr:hypothetical protein [Salinivirga cyanobacteriivorans]ALO13897.1 hypothetical protein L21SP5_00217 [Salinivirga cyanobacteriivorans]
MRKLLFIILIISTLSSHSQTIKQTQHQKRFFWSVCSMVDNKNLAFKRRLCPDIPDTVAERDWTVLYENIDPREYDGIFEIEPWPAKKPYIDYYLVKRKTPYKRYRYLRDTLEVQPTCDEHFPYDSLFLVKYDTVNWRGYIVSGNAKLHRLYLIDTIPYWQIGASSKTAIKRTAQYGVDLPLHFEKEEDDYFWWSAKGSLLSKSRLLIKVPTYKRMVQYGDTWEMIYYSNSRDIPGNEKGMFYEVKYTRSYQPESVEELFPKYRQLPLEELKQLYASSYMKFVEFERIPHNYKLLYTDDWEKAYEEPEEEEELME